MPTIRIQHLATGTEAVTVQVLQTQPSGEPLIVSDHLLRPGETHHATVRDAQRIVIIEPAPPFAEALATFRRNAKPSARNTPAEIDRAIAAIGATD